MLPVLLGAQVDRDMMMLPVLLGAQGDRDLMLPVLLGAQPASITLG